MPLSLAAMARLLPPTLPTPTEVPSAVHREFEEFDGGTEHPEGRSLIWSAYLMHRYREYLLPLFEHFAADPSSHATFVLVQPSVGFFPLDDYLISHGRPYLSAAALEIGYFFGAVLYDMRSNSRPTLPFILPQSQEFPVFQFPAVFIPDGPLDPTNAAATCWAKDRSGNEGILTCKHAVAGLSRGAKVGMVDGSQGKLVDFADGSVDAAFVATNGGLPPGVTTLAIEDNPKKKNKVAVDFRSGRIPNAQVLNGWYFPDHPDAYNSMRLFIDTWAHKGDSGSLVSMAKSGGATGIYTGRMKGNNTQQGACQYLRQAVDLLDLDLFA